jgi:excisionase family DNA binding protein
MKRNQSKSQESEQSRLATIPRTAKELCLSEPKVRKMVATREIEHVRIGRAIRIPFSAIDAFIAKATVPERRSA